MSPTRVGASLHGSADGTGLRVGIACAEFNGGITLRLLDGALGALDDAGSDRRDVTVAWAPGAFELPLVARAFAHAGKVDAVLCLGAVIRGETGHYDFVAGECASGIQQVQLATGVPVVFGVLTTDTARAGPDPFAARRVQQGPRSGAHGYRDGPSAPERAALLSGPRPGHSSAVHRVDTARTRPPRSVATVRTSMGDRHG